MSDDETTTDQQTMSDCAQTLQELDVFLDGELPTTSTRPSAITSRAAWTASAPSTSMRS